MDFTRELWFTVKVGSKESTRKFKAKWSFSQEDYVVPQSQFLSVAAELGAVDGENFLIHNPVN